MKKILIVPFVFALLLAFAWNTSIAKVEGNNATVSLAKTMGNPAFTLSNINQVAYWVWDDGISAHDPYTEGNGAFYPRGTFGAGVIYTDGLVWGGFVNDGQQPALRVGGTTYNTGLQPGAILSPGVAENPDAPDVRIWRIRRDWKTADLRQDAAEFFEKSLKDITDDDIAKLRAQYEKDWNEWPWQKGAPFYDVNGNGVLDYGYSEDLNGNGKIDFPGEIEEPGLAGADQVVWFVANDLDETSTLNLYGSPPIGLEMQTTLWAYNRTDALGKIIFKRYRLIYKGTANTPSDATIDSMFIAQWSDPDLGEYSDDFVGCDTTLSLSFVYNSVTTDVKFRAYGLAPPSAGYDFLQGPIVYTGDPNDVAIFDLKLRRGYKNLPMTAFNYFAAGSAISDPDLKEYAGTIQWYNLMNGLLPRKGTPFTLNDGVTPTKFTLAGDPVTGKGDLDGVVLPAGDRRMQMITGPFNMAVGDTQEVVVAFVVGLGADRISSVAVLKYNDIFAQNAYDNFFQLPKAPPSPKLSITNLDKKVLLNWGEDPAAVRATEGQDEKGYKFEGYNVYQLPSAQATFKDAIKLATFDVVNEVTTILNPVFDEKSGQILMQPVQLGTNSGIQRTFTVTKDAFTGKPLVNGTDYFFAVTAYNYNGSPDVPTHSLESALIIKRATPQSPPVGVRYTHTIGETLQVTHEGNSDGSCTVIVVDPTKTTGHDYKVVFEEDDQGNVTWSLVDETTGEVKLANQTNQSGDDNYLIVDGLQVKPAGPPPGIKAIVEGANGNGPLPEDQWDRAGAPFHGNNVWHSLSAPSDPNRWYISAGGGTGNIERMARSIANARAHDFEMRFTQQGGYYVWWYDADTFAVVPFEAWDVGIGTFDDNTDDIRLLTGGYSGGGTVGAFDFTYTDPAFGYPATDWVYFRRPVNDKGSWEAFVQDITSGTWSYSWWAPNSEEVLARIIICDFGGAGTLPETGTVIRWITNKPNSPADVFRFSTKAPEYSKKNALADVEKIKVYPNPYYGMNPRELTTLDRFVSFNHLPQKAIFRIFDLAGNLVRVLHKDDPSQFFKWDLKNHNNLPVASGIYIIHIEMPDLGATKILKLAVVREQEFIEVY